VLPWQQRRAQELQDEIDQRHRAATAAVIPHPAKSRQAKG